MTLLVKSAVLATVLVTVLFSASDSLALMNSASYEIWSDTISTGGNRSTSASYIVSDTIGEAATGEDQSSASFFLYSGLPAIFADPVLSVELSTNAISLSPNLSTSDVSEGSYTLTVSTNAPFGYAAQVTEDGEFRNGGETIDDVSDGTVDVGDSDEEYGIAVSGTDAAFGDDQAISATPLTVATRTNWISGSETTITHKATLGSGIPAGTYSHTVTYVVIGNF